MENKEFNLSEKIIETHSFPVPMPSVELPKDEKIDLKDVKEFIRRVLKDCCTLCEDDIKKLAGDKLNG